MITLHLDDTNTLDVQEEDSSYRYRALMAKPQLVLKFHLTKFVEIPVGAWCEWMNEKYTLGSPENIKKNGERNIEYTLTLGTDDDNLGKYKMRNTVDKRLKYSMCATPKEFIQEIVSNLNMRDGDGVWKVGTCIESTAKTIEFNHTFCDAALSSVDDTFETEHEITDHTINLGKVEYFKDDPLPLSYGKGNGFIAGLGRTTESDEKPVDILYVQGGEQNIDRSTYGSSELLLPKGQELEYEGRTYVSSADGYSLQQKGKEIIYKNEDSLDCSDIYPSRIGTVSSVEVPNADKNFYDIIDNTIPSNLNYNDYLIEGESMTIIFQSGMLAGDDKEFELTYKHAERRFEIVPQEIDGVTMPNATFKPVIGDTYAIFGCMLPDAYVCDNDTKTGASWDMFREGARHLYENEEQKFTFAGILQALWTKRNWDAVGGRLKVGSYILFTDKQFATDGISIRITGIKEMLTTPYSPTIELSNSVSGQSLSSSLREITQQEVTIEEKHKSAIQFTKRRFRDAQETISMLNDSLLNFSNAVNPISVQTMAMLVGDESLQFQFVDARETLEVIDCPITYDNKAKTLSCAHTFLQHLTLGINTISSAHSSSEYKVWEMSEYVLPVTDATKKYYLYAKVSRDDVTAKGAFLLSEKVINMDDVDGYYHLLVGVLNSEYEDERSFVSLYGYTEILPGRITTEKIVSGDGDSYFDMSANAMKLGDALDFNSQGDKKLRIKGTIVQSQSGDENYLGIFLGAFDSSRTYYIGDEVTYTVDGATSTYRYVNSVSSAGNLPTDVNYWKLIASGGVSSTSLYVEEQYSADGVNNWHNDFLSTDYFKRYRTVTVIGTSVSNGEWSVGVRCRKDGDAGYTPVYGTDYHDGTDGSFVSFIYKLSDSSLTPTGGTFDGTTETVPTGWSDDPVYSSTVKTQVSITRYSQKNDGTWENSGWSASVQYLGQDGADGSNEEKVYKRTEMNITPDKPSTSQIDDYVPYSWTDDPQGVSTEYPYEWVAIRTKDNDVWSAFTNPVIWATYSLQPNANLLEQTDFESAERMDKWSSKSQMASSNSAYSGVDNYSSPHIKKNGKDGRNYYYDEVTKTLADIDYKEILSQIIWGYSDSSIRKVTGYNWYTLSFWMRCYVNAKYINNTSSDYGFAQQTLYLKTGVSYKITISGKIDSQALSDGKTLRVYIYNSAWTETAYVDIATTSISYQTMTFTPSTTGLYYISAYLYNDAAPRTGKATLYSLKVETPEDVAVSYLYPSIINTSKSSYFDGKEISSQIDGNCGFVLNSNWIKHTYTFYAKYPSGEDQKLLFRLFPSVLDGQSTCIEICMPKLEVGKNATAYSLNITDSKGDKGSCVLFRGVYDSTKTYYGTSIRQDAVKYNDIYYIARSDAGTFTGIVPTNTAYWDTFGAQFESVATNLLLAENANIGDWYMSGGKIVSTLTSGNKITLDAALAKILIESATDNGGYSIDKTIGSKIELNANNGIIQVQAKTPPKTTTGVTYSTGTSYVSPNGIFANLAGTEALSGTTGCLHRGAIVGLGFANVGKSDWDTYLQTIIAGVYGLASNSGDAPAYGGYFQNLMAAGFNLSRRAISKSTTDNDSSSNTAPIELNDSDSLVVGYQKGDATVYLPKKAEQGRMVTVTQWWSGNILIKSSTGQKIYHGTSSVDYFMVIPGEICTCYFVIGYIDSVKTEAWLCTSYKTGA